MYTESVPVPKGWPTAILRQNSTAAHPNGMRPATKIQTSWLPISEREDCSTANTKAAVSGTSDTWQVLDDLVRNDDKAKSPCWIDNGLVGMFCIGWLTTNAVDASIISAKKISNRASGMFMLRWWYLAETQILSRVGSNPAMQTQMVASIRAASRRQAVGPRSRTMLKYLRYLRRRFVE